MRSLKQIEDACRQMMLRKASIDNVTSFLRDEGLTKVESIAVLARMPNFGLVKAKGIIHTGPTWADMRERDDELHQSLEKGADNDSG